MDFFYDEMLGNDPAIFTYQGPNYVSNGSLGPMRWMLSRNIGPPTARSRHGLCTDDEKVRQEKMDFGPLW